MTQAAETPVGETIYERVGGYEGFQKIADTLLRLHHQNPLLERRYGHAQKSDEDLARLVTELLCSATGGPQKYTGMSMIEAHTGMNVHSDEFVEVLDDILKALELNGVSKEDQDTILALNYGLKNDIVGR
jgi:hemoglobin